MDDSRFPELEFPSMGAKSRHHSLFRADRDTDEGRSGMRAGRSSQVDFRPLQIVRQPTPRSMHHGKPDVNEKAKA